MNIIRVVGYVGAEQELVMPPGYSADATAYLWGGGGGSGGSDAKGQGGAGQGGGYVRQTLTLNAGDSLKLAIGGGGGGGLGGVNNRGGGAAGASIIPDTLFDTRAQVDLTPVSYRGWGNFMNTHGMWGGGYSFSRSYNVYFPYTGYYTFYASVDDYAAINLDGGPFISISNNATTFEGVYNYTVTQGYHNISFICENRGGGPAGFALVITNNSINGYSGGRGGNAGPSGYSGAGGGGGGATVLQLNGEVIAVAGGGAGGGGAGNGPSGSPGGTGTTAATYTTNGQNGQDKSGDGGGGGGGGGGYPSGGNGGYCVPGDSGAGGGGSSTSYGDVTENPVGRVPGGHTSTYYPAGDVVAYGGARGNANPGGPGYAVIELVPHTIQVHKDGAFQPVVDTYLKLAGEWRHMYGVYIKINGEWVPIAGVNSNYAPAFQTNTDNFGINARGIDPEATPTKPSFQWFGYGHPVGDSGFGGGGGGGGGGGACFTADTQVLTASGSVRIADIKVGDQVFNWDRSTFNTVAFVERVLDTEFTALYTPDQDHECFATVNHPLYINGKLCSIDPDKIYDLHPWLGRTQPLTPHKVVPARGELVYNLWTTGDSTYVVNGYGTTSIVGDGGMLRLLAEQQLMSVDRVSEILLNFNRRADRNLNQGAYLLNNLFGRLNIKFINRIFATVYADDSRVKTQTVFEAIFKLVGRLSLSKD